MCDREIAIECPPVRLRKRYAVYHKIYKFHRIPHLVVCNCRVLCRRSPEDQRVVQCSVIDFVGDTTVSVWIEFHPKIQLFSFERDVCDDHNLVDRPVDPLDRECEILQDSVISLIQLPLAGKFCTCRLRRDCETVGDRVGNKRRPLRRQRHVEELDGEWRHLPSSELYIDEDVGIRAKKAPEENYWRGIDTERNYVYEGSHVPEAEFDSIHPCVSTNIEDVGGDTQRLCVTGHLSVANEVVNGDGMNGVPASAEMVRSLRRRRRYWSGVGLISSQVECDEENLDDVNSTLNRLARSEKIDSRGLWVDNSMVIDSRVLAWMMSYVRDVVFVALTRSTQLLNHGHLFTFLYHIRIECETHWPITFEPNRVRFLTHHQPFPRLLLDITIQLQFTGQHYTASGIQCRKLNTLWSTICPPTGRWTPSYSRKMWRQTLPVPCLRPAPEFMVSFCFPFAS
ncbi:hypothetical protein DMENIID0001_023840 [Sergentomyia squamirostris]